MTKIDVLPAHVVNALPSIRDEWLKKGLATGPCDREACENALALTYEAAGLVKPKTIVWLRSPMEGALGAAMLAQVMEQVMDQVRKQVGTQVMEQVMDQVRKQVGTQVWKQVMDQVRKQVGTQVWEQVMDQVREQVGEQVMDQVWEQVGDQVGDQVREQVMAQVGDQVGDQVGEQVREQVMAQVGDQVWAQVRDQVRDQVGDQVRAQVGNQVWAQVGDQVGDQVRDQVWEQVWEQVRDQVWDQVGNRVWDQVRDQVGDQVRAQVRAQVGDQVRRACYGQHDAGWLSFYSTFSGMLPCVDRLAGLFGMTACGWWWPFAGAAILTERPSVLRRDDRNRLHCETGAAVEYPDGFAVFAWHGTRVPREWIMDRASLDPATALNWPNVEQRRCAAEIIGWTRILDHVGATVIDQDADPMIGTLLSCDIPESPGTRFLRVLCGTGRDFCIPVPQEMKSALQANAWTYGDEDDLDNFRAYHART